MKIFKSIEYLEKININPINMNDLINVKNNKTIESSNNSIIYLKQYVNNEFLNNFDSIRYLITGNIELISKKAKYKDNEGLKIVLYITQDPPYWRRWRPNFGDLKYGWTNTPYIERNCTTIEEMIDSFVSWINKNVIF